MEASGLLLEVRDLQTWFDTRDGTVRAVDGVSFGLRRGESLGIVGESGCGKSVTSLSILGLLPRPAGRIVHGEILYAGQDISRYTQGQMRNVRGREIAMIFQEPASCLNPVYTVGNQIVEAILNHRGGELTRRQAASLAVELLEKVRIPDPARAMKRYPHELSGGMNQRVMIAMALSCSPRLLICDEPTTALDVTVQAQILSLIARLREELAMAVLFITHDLSVVREVTDRVLVMYAGQVMEEGSVGDLFARPLHPYTEALFKSVPSLDREEEELYTIRGTVPGPDRRPTGCLFADRCDYVTDACRLANPALTQYGASRVRCIRYA